MIASLLVAAACTPPFGSEGGDVVTTMTGESGSVQSGSNGGGVVIEVTPMSEAEVGVRSAE
ncbi:MAG: hypothetical protein M3220_22160 [Chloroflexota bacterium]|nr:hypothetical protein [Chloroflexota bacterium]